MPRRDIIPGYLSQDAWTDMADAVDSVFATRVDGPTYAMRKLRFTKVLTASGEDKVASGQLLDPALDLEVFDSETQTKQINSCGLLITSKGFFSDQQLARLYRELPKFWYSKGTYRLEDFISYVFATPVTIKRAWTNDYVTFLPEGDAGIGTPVYASGSWYPTTHVFVTIDGAALPGGIPLDIFAKFIEELLNYYLVPIYNINYPAYWITSETSPYVLIQTASHTVVEEIITSYAITSAETGIDFGSGGFRSIAAIVIPGSGGTGWTDPPAPVADFTASVTSGAAPLTVTFTNSTTGYQTGQSWDFNDDGVIESTEYNGVYTFTSPGTYTVRLSSSNPFGSHQRTRAGYITVT